MSIFMSYLSCMSVLLEMNEKTNLSNSKIKIVHHFEKSINSVRRVTLKQHYVYRSNTV